MLPLRLDFQDGISQRQEAVRALQARGISVMRACQLAGESAMMSAKRSFCGCIASYACKSGRARNGR